MSLRGSTGAPAGLLGREVGGGAHDRAGLGQVLVGRVAERPGDAEVGHLHAAVAGDEHVAGLDVAVDHAVAVGEAEGGGDVGGDLGGAVGVQPALVAQHLGQRVALDVLHHDEVGAVGLAPVEHADDVRVLQVGGRLRLAAEPLDEALVGRQGREQHLDRDRAVEQLVARQVHLGHAAAPEPPVELVPAVEDDLVLLRHAIPRLRDGGMWPRVRRRAVTRRRPSPRPAAVLAVLARPPGTPAPAASPPRRWAPPPGRQSARWRPAAPRR